MYNVIKWITEIAEADEGRVPKPELDKRLSALQELGQNGRDMEFNQFQETMTVAHFTQYFGDAISRAFLDDYAYQIGQWPNYVYMDTAPDFRNVDRYRMTEPEGLLQAVEGKVWRWVVRSGELTTARQQYIISSTARRSDGVHVRVVSETPPAPDARSITPTLEDAYLYFISSANGEMRPAGSIGPVDSTGPVNSTGEGNG